MGALGAVVLITAFVLVPRRAASEEVALDRVAREIVLAVESGDARALQRAREELRRQTHRDLLGQTVPVVLRMVDVLARTSPGCDPGEVGAFERGICLIRHGRYKQALVAFAGVSKAQGGALYREMTVRLIAENRRQRSRRP